MLVWRSFAAQLLHFCGLIPTTVPAFSFFDESKCAKCLHAKIVNYADDMCRPGSGEQTMVLSGLMARLRLCVNEEKTTL